MKGMVALQNESHWMHWSRNCCVQDVEKQMPKKYHHVLSCKLSKRQRILYDDFMNLATTKDAIYQGMFSGRKVAMLSKATCQSSSFNLRNLPRAGCLLIDVVTADCRVMRFLD